MSMKKLSYYHQILNTLEALNTNYPAYNMGRHLATALDEYGDLWGLSDKEMMFALEKYKTQLEMDIPHTDDNELDQIIKDGMNLEDILKEDDGEDY